MANEHQKKLICQVAGKLIVEGLQPSKFTKKQAKFLTRDVVAPHLVHGAIDKFPKQIKTAMKNIKKKGSC